MEIKNILVVCVGNICRSPMAEYFFKQHFLLFNIHSAGLAALVGQSADTKAIACMDRFDINIRDHIAKQINEKIIIQSDLILAMSHKQRQHIEQTWPFSKGKVFRLGHWQNQNVADPYTHDQAFFDDTCHAIQNYVLDWKSHL